MSIHDDKRLFAVSAGGISAFLGSPAFAGGWINHPASTMPQIAPKSCATMKPGRSIGRMPENVFVNERAIATAGLAKDVEAVNQQAAVM